MKQNDSIRHVMSTDLVTAKPTQKFSEIKKLMEDNALRHLPVVEGKKIIGIISRSDLFKVSFSSAFSNDKDADSVLDHTLKLDDFMTHDVLTIKETDTVKHAARLLAQRTFHSLPVVNDKDELVGMVSTHDLLQYLLDQY
jgi:CBS domain-containing protein